MLKLRAVFTVALVVSAPASSASLLVVCADEAARNLKDDVSDIYSGTKTVVKMAGPKAPATACVSQTGVRRQECFAAAGGAANVESVLVISTAGQAGVLTVTFEVLSATDGKQQRREVLRTTTARFKTQAVPVLKRVAAAESGKKRPDPVPTKKPELVSATPTPTSVEPPVTDPAPPLAADRPLATALVEPTSLEPSPDVVATAALTEAPPSSHTGAWVATGGAIAAAVVAGTFAGLGFSNQAQLMRTTNGVSPLTYSQAQAQQRTANLQLTVALGAAIAAGVSGGLAGFLWSRN